MSWKKLKLKQILKQYRIEHLVQNDIEYKQVTISKYDGVTFRGSKIGREIGRKRQFQIDLKKYPNTLMFVRQGVQNGSIGLAPLEVDGCIATENMPMFSVEGINLEYLKFLLKSPYFYDELNKIQTTGSAQKSIHEREILEIEIPFPDIDEQEKIVEVLSSKKDNSLEIYTELTHQLTLVKKLRQQLLQDAVQGKLVEQNPKDEPASELLKKIKAEKQKLIAEKKLKKEKDLPPIKPEEIPFDIPENWVWCRLGEICEFRNGKAHEQYIREEGKFILVTSRFVSTSGKQIKRATKMLTPLYKNEIAIVMSDVPGGRALGRAYLIERDDTYTLNQRIGGISPFIINSHYLCLSLDRNMHFLNFDDGKKQTNLRKDQILSCLIPIPPVYEQNRIVQKLDELMQYCNELEASIKESESQNEKLLQQVLREALRKEPILEND